MKRFLLLFAIVCLLAGMIATPAVAKRVPPPPVTDDDEYVESSPSGDAILADVLVVRPLGIVACIVGLGGSFVTMPFAASSNTGDRVGRALLQEPFDYTFRRPLGDIE